MSFSDWNVYMVLPLHSASKITRYFNRKWKHKCLNPRCFSFYNTEVKDKALPILSQKWKIKFKSGDWVDQSIRFIVKLWSTGCLCMSIAINHWSKEKTLLYRHTNVEDTIPMRLRYDRSYRLTHMQVNVIV